MVPYTDILTGKCTAGRRVAIIGAGGIGYDVADFLTHDYEAHNSSPNFDSVRNDNVSVLADNIDKVCYLVVLSFVKFVKVWPVF